MDSLAYLLRDTWSHLDMEPFELRALAAMVERAEPATEAERVIRDRVLDANHRRLNRPVLAITDPIELDHHLREMHGTLVYNFEFQQEHDEQHARGMPDDGMCTPHTHI